MSHSSAHRMWAKARYFADRARSTDVNDRLMLEADIEAAIVFGRSALDHLRKQYARVVGFDTYERAAFNGLRSDPLCAPFLDLRDFVIHQDSSPTRNVITASVAMSVMAFMEIVDVQIVRGQPWYRRSPAILWQDLRAKIGRWLRKRRKRHTPAERPSTSSSVSESLHFMDFPTGRSRSGTLPVALPQPFKEQPALDVVDHWLDEIQKIVLDVETKFGIP
jgi:hypothetical protein